MDDETAQALIARLDALERDMVRYRQGTVTAASPLSVALGGSDVSYTDVAALGSYSPSTNDTAATITFGNDMLVLGSIGGSGAVPPGTIAMWATGTAPTGWLICDGSAFSGATYPNLQAALGGTTLPNLAGRFPLGKNGSHAIGTTGGAETHTLSTNEMPAHAHGFSNGGQALGNGAGTNANVTFGGGGFVLINGTDAQGLSQAHNNMPPYLTVNFIIKT